MPIRDILLVLVLIFLVPVCLFRPWIGILGWLWVAYMVPHGLTWGFGRSIPVAMLIGGATLLGYVFTRDRKPLPRTWGVALLFAFVVHFTVTTVFGHNPELSWGKWNWVAKGLLMAVVTMTLIQDRLRLRYVYMVTALGLSVYGVRGALWVIRTGGGGGWVLGPELSFFADNNTVGLALDMILPILLYLSREEKRPWLKFVYRLTFGLNIVAILFTYSRGAFVGLVFILGILVWRSPWRMRFATTVLLLALVLAPLAPDRLWERMGSIQAQESEETRDGSVRGRLEAWQVAWAIALDSPYLGGGFRALWNQDLWLRYLGDNYTNVRDAHGILFEVISEHGFLGLGLYLALLCNLFLTLRRLRRRWRNHPDYGYLSHYAEMTQLSLYAFLAAGTFLAVAYFDLYFNLVAATFVLHVLSAEAAKVTVGDTTASVQTVAPPLTRARRLGQTSDRSMRKGLASKAPVRASSKGRRPI